MWKFSGAHERGRSGKPLRSIVWCYVVLVQCLVRYQRVAQRSDRRPGILPESAHYLKNKNRTFQLSTVRRNQEAADGLAMTRLRPSASVLPETERPTPHAKMRSGFLNRWVQPLPLAA
jgi:hypothetical protein